MANIPRNAVLILGLGQFGWRVMAHLRARLDAVDARRAMFYAGDRPELFDETTPYHGMRRFLDNCLELRGQVPLASDLTALAALQVDKRSGALALAVPRSQPAADRAGQAPEGGVRFEVETLLPALAEMGAAAFAAAKAAARAAPSRPELFARVLQQPAPVSQRLMDQVTPLFSQKNFPDGEVTCSIYVVGALTELATSALAWPVTAALRQALLQKLGASFEPRLRVVGVFSLATFEPAETATEAAALAALYEFEHFSRPASRNEPETQAWLSGADPLFLEACGRRLWQPCYLVDRAKLEPPLQVQNEYELICSVGNFLEASVLTALAAVIDNRCHNYVADMERLAPYSTLGAATHCLPVQELAYRGESFRVKEILRTQVLLEADEQPPEALRQAARQEAAQMLANEFAVEVLVKDLANRSGRLLTVESAPAAKGADANRLPAVPRLTPRLDRPRSGPRLRTQFLWPEAPGDWYQQGLSWYRQELQSWFRRPEDTSATPTREERLRAALGLEVKPELWQRWGQAALATTLTEAWLRRILDLTLERLSGEAGLLRGLFYLEALAAGLDRERYRLLERGEAPHKRDFELKKRRWQAQFMRLAEARPDMRRVLLRLLLMGGVTGLPVADYAVSVLPRAGLSLQVEWGLGLWGGALGLTTVAALGTVADYAVRTRRLQTEFLQLYQTELALTVEDQVYLLLKQAYDLAHGLVSHLFAYLQQTYDTLHDYVHAAYAWRLPETSFTFNIRFHPELNRRILALPERTATGRPASPTPPASAELKQILQYQGALFVAGHGRPAEAAQAAPRLAREALAASLSETATAPQALAGLVDAGVRSPVYAGWRALPGSAQLTLEDFLADTSFATGAPLSLAEQMDQGWKQALPNLDINRNMLRDELKDVHPGWELRQQNFAEVMPLTHAAMILGLPNEANPAFAKSAGQVGATVLASLDPFSLTLVRTLHGLALSAESFARVGYLARAFERLAAADRQRLCLPLPAAYPATGNPAHV